MKLADTSYCIDYLKNRLSRLEEPEFEKSLAAGEVAINPVVWVELVCGTKGKRDEQHLKALLNLTQLLDFDWQAWQKTAEIARVCHQNGANVPLSDIQVMSTAVCREIPLLHHDKHFSLIREAILKHLPDPEL